MFHSFIGVAPWFLFFVAIEHLGELQLAVANILRSISTLFFVIVNSFAATTGSLVSNLIGADERGKVFPLCNRVIRLGYAIGLPLIALALVFHQPVVSVYTDNPAIVQTAWLPFVVMLLNYVFALPGMMSIWLFATPMNGLSKSSSFSPVALSKLLCGVFSHPFLIVSLLIYRPNEKILTNYTKGRYNFATKTNKGAENAKHIHTAIQLYKSRFFTAPALPLNTTVKHNHQN
jgi:hypothetical protein